MPCRALGPPEVKCECSPGVFPAFALIGLWLGMMPGSGLADPIYDRESMVAVRDRDHPETRSARDHDRRLQTFSKAGGDRRL